MQIRPIAAAVVLIGILFGTVGCKPERANTPTTPPRETPDVTPTPAPPPATTPYSPSVPEVMRPPGGSPFAMLDKNGDGDLDTTEAAAEPMLREFARYDIDGDGRLTAREYDDALRTP